MQLRHALESDADEIARIQAESWRATYRGILTAEFLDGPVFEERRRLWRQRLAADSASRLVALVVDEAAPLAFACAFLDADPIHGALLDNLHVLPDAQRRGLGRLLMAFTAHWISSRRAESPMHLWVYAGNARACAFYSALGGQVMERRTLPTPDGRDACCWRYRWSNLRELADESAAALTVLEQ